MTKKRRETSKARTASIFIPAKEILSNCYQLNSAVARNNVKFDDTYIDLMVKRNNKQEKKMSKENFEKQIRKRMEQLDEINKHGIFKELKGTVIDFNYDTKSLTMTFEATKFHENAFGIMFGGSLAGMFDIAFGTLTAGLGDYSVAPTVQENQILYQHSH